MGVLRIRGIEEGDFQGKRVLVRVDFNVALDEEGEIQDTYRIEKAKDTIDYLKKEAKQIILISHLGRPGGKRVRKYSLRKVAKKIEEIYGEKVSFVSRWENLTDGIKGKMALLENIRFYPEETSEEEKKRLQFAKKLAQLGDIYVNEAFSVCHRNQASVVELAKILPSYGGFLLKKEVEVLSSLAKSPKRPFVVVIGGAKVSTKLNLLRALLGKADYLLIGGAMAYTFLKSKGLDVGSSYVEKEMLSHAFQILSEADYYGSKIFLPEDHIAISTDGKTKKTFKKEIPLGYQGMDIGSATVKKYTKVLKQANTIFWNGPMGVFEKEEFAKGTKKIAEAIANSSAVSVVGGGDSAYAVRKMGLEKAFHYVSTGGGASLKLLEGKPLPGIEPLME